MDLFRERARWFLPAGGAAAVMIAVTVRTLLPRSVPAPSPYEAMIRVSSGSFTGSLDSALKAEGFDARSRLKVSEALRAKLNLRRLRAEDSYTVAYSTWGPVKYLFITKALENYFLFPAENGGYSLSVRAVDVRTSSGKTSGGIKSSLWESMSARGVSPALILDYADIFSWSIDFLTEVRDGDRWALAWESRTDPAGRVVSQKVTAAFYEGAETGRKNAAVYAGGYYDENGQSLRSMFLRAPLHYRRISSYFTYKRFHPILKYMRPHLGIDYAAPYGTPVSAVADGTVSFAGWKGGNGNLLVLRHGGGYETTYGHLSRYARGIRAGRRVTQGDLIAYVGSTGLSSGPHLDFRLKRDGKPLNFLKIKYRSGAGVSGHARETLAAAIKALSD